MVTVAIVSEYNPFHTGHKFHFEKIREEFGKETRIISIMSGNYTQRGDIAIMDKSLRAECAVISGADLVLEIPFPFSMGSAEIFAKCGVEIANKLSVVDYLSFGSECGDINQLSIVANNMLSKEYKNELNRLVNSEDKIGYAALMEKAYNNLYKKHINKTFFTANNILAIEYIKQIKLQSSNIIPHTIKRIGSEYRNENIIEAPHQSATAIRLLMRKNINSAMNYIPQKTNNTVLSAYFNGEFPTDVEKLSSSIISHFRLNSSLDKTTHDSDEGLYNRLRNNSFKANTISMLTQLTDTKKYTHARIKRAIWYSFFGVTSSEIKRSLEYTQVLAMNSVGKSILKEVKKMKAFPVLTKPSANSALPFNAIPQKQRADAADSIFQLTKPRFVSGNASLIKTPFILD